MMTNQHPDQQAGKPGEGGSGTDLDVEGALAALRRAALQARLIAQQTGTDLIAMRDGKVVRVPPEQVGRHRGGGG